MQIQYAGSCYFVTKIFLEMSEMNFTGLKFMRKKKTTNYSRFTKRLLVFS